MRKGQRNRWERFESIYPRDSRCSVTPVRLMPASWATCLALPRSFFFLSSPLVLLDRNRSLFLFLTLEGQLSFNFGRGYDQHRWLGPDWLRWLSTHEPTMRKLVSGMCFKVCRSSLDIGGLDGGEKKRAQGYGSEGPSHVDTRSFNDTSMGDVSSTFRDYKGHPWNYTVMNFVPRGRKS